ncbi:MAG: hypothetical protein HYZ29_34425 [Myxococcales bacterium]|nr:hypothetical protein [Myxococcales bacterium]
MSIDIPADVSEIVARKKRQVVAREAHFAALETTRARAAAIERADAFEPARRALAFARALASELSLPADGLEIFATHRGRAVTRVRVRQDGTLFVQHAVQPFGGFRVHATRESDLLDNTPADFIHALAAAIESGEVWTHVRDRT